MLDLNSEFSQALHLLETGTQNLLITGKAGTGKSTLLEHFKQNTQKQVVVLAPTGVAALNVKGQTIHSFFRFPYQMTSETIYELRPPKSLINILNKADIIIIDEISMVRADLFDYINQALQVFLHSDEPFGGKRLAVIGDLYQLPPVVTNEDRELFQHNYNSPYFFSAEAFNPNDWQILELEKIYRQSDDNFIKLLNRIRNNTVSQNDLDWLNQRVNIQSENNAITLTTTNRAADQINEASLSQLVGQTHQLPGKVSGDFSDNFLPTHKNLSIKVGAQIMLLLNDQQNRFVNGSIGTITAINPDPEKNNQKIVTIKLNTGKVIHLKPHSWEINKYKYNSELNKVETEIIGSFTQYPFKLAWAVTIHKSQGKTFDQTVVDIGNGTFTHGQVYVALSRCRSFQGLVLKKPIQKRHIWQNRAVDNFLEAIRQYQ